MLTNGQFFSSFVFTLCVIGSAAVLAGIAFIIQYFSRLFRKQPIPRMSEMIWESLYRSAIWLIILIMPFLLFVVQDMPRQSIIGVVVAGALIGIIFAPFAAWHYRQFGVSRMLNVSLLTIIGGVWGSSMLIAILIGMASD